MDRNDDTLDQPELAVQEAEGEQASIEAGDESVTSDTPAEEEFAEGSLLSSEDLDEPRDQVEAPATEENGDAAVETNPTDEQLFLAALNGDVTVRGSDDFSITPLERGQIVKGTVASKSESEILVDVGAKSEGIISGRELEFLDIEVRDSLQVGEDVYVYVLTPEDREGNPRLSLRRAMEEQDWRDAEEYLTTKNIYHSKIAGYNKGGLIVRFGKVRGFVPASQVSRERRRRSNGTTPDERWGSMVGEEIAVKVIEVDRGRNRLILSEQTAARELRAQRRVELLNSLEVGQVHTGRVISLADFGAFVDLGGVDGLVHLSELSWRHVTHPREVLQVGDEIQVEIIHIDREKQRIGLSHKACLEDPWVTLAANYRPGQLVQGTVTKMTKFGAFARLVEHPEIEGLIHVSEMSDRRVGHPREVVEENEILTLRIIRIDPERRRMGLSMKRVDMEEYLDDDWHDVIEALNNGDVSSPAEDEEEVFTPNSEPVAEVDSGLDLESDDEPVAEPIDEPAAESDDEVPTESESKSTVESDDEAEEPEVAS